MYTSFTVFEYCPLDRDDPPTDTAPEDVPVIQAEPLSEIPEEEEVEGTRREEDPESLEPLPTITPEQYHVFLVSLIKLLVGEQVLQDWIQKGKLITDPER